MSKAHAILDDFKAQGAEDAATLFWVKSNPDVAKLVFSWPKVPVQPAKAPAQVPTRDADRWAWLWSNYAYSVEDWLALAAIVDFRYGVRLVERVIRLRLVYPDNTLPDWVEQLITLNAVATLAKLTPKEEGGGNDGKQEN